ncbi:elongation factor G [Vallitalea guaymasensis]|uniref:elongation factor G n=1 Tax=Vallitalea guaymasensis TaxID=1185412 RepID=UPI000DE49B7E|nr:TetM/TetW/TetO/TetS family tetracycline resistance ribosomal protection protein [Vallitalea guaymasensis]
MYKTIGMVAHVDAGKTTLLEQILYHTNSIKEAGRVDNKNTVLDYHTIEKERGITIFSDQAVTTYNNCTYQLVDTPGHVDFSNEMERAIRILDYAIIIISAVEGIEGHTETVWQLLRKYNIPTMFFINKLDRVGADFNNTVNEIKNTFTKDLMVISSEVTSENISYLLDNPTSELIESLADYDDDILNKYIDGIGVETEELVNTVKRLFNDNVIYPCLCGIGLKGIGIKELLRAIDTLTISGHTDGNGDFPSGTVYKIRYDNTGNKLTFIKLHNGSLKVKDTITHRIMDNEITEKINEIRIYNGTKYTLCDKACQGQLIAVTGLGSSYIGEGIGDIEDYNDFLLVPTLKSKVIYDSAENPKEILKIFTMLTEENPSLDVLWIEELKEIHIKVMGTIQLEVLTQIVLDRFGKTIDFGTPEILYKETIASKTHGFGHFEPLKHYAEIEFDIEPAPRGSGISIDSVCSVDVLHTRWQRLSQKNIPDACKKGILTGSPLTDVNITLTTGKSHVKHTSGGDFRQATFRAIRQGIEKVDNILLEPFYQFKVKIEKHLSGRVMTDITKMHGSFDSPVTMGEHVMISGRVPVSTAMNYPSTLASFSSGKGSITFVFAGYNRCHNTDEVIERLGYDKDADKDYTSTSIFCSHGKAYGVRGSEINGD